MRRIAMFILLPLALAAVAVLLVNQHDQALNPALAAILRGDTLEQVAPADNLFFDLIGLGSADSEQLNAEGQRIFRAYQNTSVGQGTDTDVRDIYQIAHTETLRFIGKSGDLCSLLPDSGEFHCIGDAQSKEELWRKYLADNHLLLQRYLQLPLHPRYLGLFPPDVLAPGLEWSLVGNAKRLLLASWAIQIQHAGVDAVIPALIDDNNRWRAFLALKNPMLLDKMVAMAQVRADFLFASELMRRCSLAAGQYEALSATLRPLSKEEASLAGAFMGETRWHDAILRKETNFYGSDPSQSTVEHFENFLARMLYLPNATDNRMFDSLQRLALVSEQSCDKLDAAIAAETAKSAWTIEDLLYNFTGNKLVSISNPAYYGYPHLACDLEGIRRLVGLQLGIRRNRIPEADIGMFVAHDSQAFADPYSGLPMRWDAQRHSLSFNAREKRIAALMPMPI